MRNLPLIKYVVMWAVGRFKHMGVRVGVDQFWTNR